MASTNQPPQYAAAEKKYLSAQSDEEKLSCLDEMLKFFKKHKGSEKMYAELKSRKNKFLEKIERKKQQKKKTARKEGIRKEEMQAVLIGLTNSGKSTILSVLTNANPEIGIYQYTTKYPNIGTLFYEDVRIQIIDLPAIESEFTDQGIINSADTLLITTTSPSELEQIFPFLEKSTGKQIIILNKSELLSVEEKRKITAFLQSKKYNFVIFSAKTKENISELKEKIWLSFDKIRIYTKEPGKKPTIEPMIMPKGSLVEDVARKISKSLLQNVKETKLWGPSSKFPGQIVGLKHELKDKDIVEFHTR